MQMNRHSPLSIETRPAAVVIREDKAAAALCRNAQGGDADLQGTARGEMSTSWYDVRQRPLRGRPDDARRWARWGLGAARARRANHPRNWGIDVVFGIPPIPSACSGWRITSTSLPAPRRRKGSCA
eukprot:scaffold38150_cov65-Phaeocystis_antarctica.AAC.13